MRLPHFTITSWPSEFVSVTVRVFGSIAFTVAVANMPNVALRPGSCCSWADCAAHTAGTYPHAPIPRADAATKTRVRLVIKDSFQATLRRRHHTSRTRGTSDSSVRRAEGGDRINAQPEVI